jgi:hypothetical protein
VSGHGTGEVVRRRLRAHIREGAIVTRQHFAAEERIPQGIDHALIEASVACDVFEGDPDPTFHTFAKIERANLMQLCCVGLP